MMIQKKEAHLDMIEGVVVDCLRAKWNAFIGARFSFFKFDTNTLCQRSKFAQTLDILSFVKQFVCYLLFLGITVAAFGLRSIETKVFKN